MRQLVRLGSIRYVNSLPIDHGILSGAVPSPFAVTRAIPSNLNAMLSEGSLDLSPVSALHFAEHSDELEIIPDLSISSRSGVKSVLLISRFPAEKLSGKRVALTPQGKTTPALLKILLVGRFAAHAEFVLSDNAGKAVSSGADACLLIGDDALRAAAGDLSPYYVYDLAEVWKAWTGLPFVFAVWAIRKSFVRNSPHRAQEAISALQQSKRWGELHRAEIVAAAAKQTGFESAVLEDYFRNLCYDYDEDLRQGMAHYLRLAREHEIIGEPVNTGEYGNARIVG